MPSGKEEVARAFYAGLLGMREVQKPVNLAKCGGCWFESGETRLHLGLTPEAYRAKWASSPTIRWPSAMRKSRHEELAMMRTLEAELGDHGSGGGVASRPCQPSSFIPG
jgi:catechol 2,3-dioxygenase-like lactoylglutathione lyase family enzyme